MENVTKYLEGKIKDKAAIKKVEEMIKKDGLVNLDFEDVKSILDNAEETTIFSGTEADIEKMDCSKCSGALLFMEGPTGTTLDQTRWIVEKIADKLDEDATIVWAVKIKDNAKKITFLSIMAQNKKEVN